MAYEITSEDVWVAEIDDRSGGVAEKLEALSRVGVDLEFMIGRRAPEKPGKGVVFLAPFRGDEATRAAVKAGLSQWTSAATLRIQGPNKPGLGALIAWTVANEDISLRGISAAKLGDRSVFYLAFDSRADGDKARNALINALEG
ncbi:MAG: amino acid-binding protein [Phycisphaerae bacterium]|jgi:hypothetical protein